MKTVYLLQSQSNPNTKYIGITDDMARRLAEHNAGNARHTAKNVPWKLVVAVSFNDDSRALAFEKYLKIGSGHAFAKRHFW